MYDKLTESLRKCGRLNMGDECICFHDGCCEAEPTCMYELMRKAADAIEELSKPHWIPTTEQLPKTRESILGKKSNKVIVAFRFSDGTQGTDTAHTLNGEWVFEDHITVVKRTITHWQPLPEPPKEEA